MVETIKITVDGETIEIPQTMIGEHENGKGDDENE